MNFKNVLKIYFTFSRREINGIIMLLSILTLVIIFNRILPLIITPPDPYSEFRNEITAFITEQKRVEDSVKKADSIRKSKYYKYKKKEKYKSEDPVRKKTINTSKSHQATPAIVELNSADTVDLMAVYGIGPVFSSRILKYKNLLGGFYKKEQLLEVYGIDSSVYQNISRYIKTDTSLIRKIDINNADFKKLLRHPYLEYEDVKKIFNLRRKDKNISKKELSKIGLSNMRVINYLK